MILLINMSFLAIYLTASLVLLIMINSTTSILYKFAAHKTALGIAPDKNEYGYGCALILILSILILNSDLSYSIFAEAGLITRNGIPESITPYTYTDVSLNKFSLLIENLILMLTVIIVQIVKPIRLKESALLVTFSTLGLILMIETENLIGLYLAVELYSLSAYILASGAEGVYSPSLMKNPSGNIKEWMGEQNTANKSSIGAGLKYFILSALSSGVLVVGISLLYGVTGELSINGLTRALSMLTLNAGSTGFAPGMASMATQNGTGSYLAENILAIVGAGLIICTLLFKIGAAPLHFWVPDVYSKVSLFVNFYMISVPKIGILYTLVKISFILMAGCHSYGMPSGNVLSSLFLGFSLLSLVVGAIGGLVQIKTTRLLAYSSINHVGYILLALYAAHIPCWLQEETLAYSAPSPLHIYGIGLYLLVYCFMTVNMFTVLYCLKFYREQSSLSSFAYQKGAKVRGDFISGLKGLSALNPFLAASMAVTLLSMAGVPPLAGFVAKLTVYIGVLDSGAFAPAVFAVLCSVVSAVYYLRLIKVAYFYKSKDSDVSTSALTSNSIACLRPTSEAPALRQNGSNAADGITGGAKPMYLTSFASNLISLCTLLIIFFPIIRPQFIFLYLN